MMEVRGLDGEWVNNEEQREKSPPQSEPVICYCIHRLLERRSYS